MAMRPLADMAAIALIRALPAKLVSVSAGSGRPRSPAEDSSAGTDANFVMTGEGGIVEIQGTAEGEPFSQDTFLELLALARQGIGELVAGQKAAIA